MHVVTYTIARNTDMQALSSSLADTTITLGKNTARGLGAGGVPAVGRAAAIDASAEIEALVRGAKAAALTTTRTPICYPTPDSDPDLLSSPAPFL